MSLPTVPLVPSGGEIPLADHAGLVLRAGRMGTVLPHIGWVLVFPDRVDRADLESEAARLASSPYAFGRRVAPPRIPGGRPRWIATRAAPPVRISSLTLDREKLTSWLDAEIAVPLDPEHEYGWRMAAVYLADGGTAVLVVVHHLFGNAPGILNAAYGDGSKSAMDGTTVVPFSEASRYDLHDELSGLRERIGLGLAGAGKVALDATRIALRSRESRPVPPAVDPPPPAAPKGFDRTRLDPGPARSVAIATFDPEVWDGVAAQRGGTGNTLVAAVTANLVRRARMARGGDVDRPVRMQLPMMLETGDRRGPTGPRNNTTTAALVVEGGPPVRGDLTVLRQWMKAAFQADSDAPPVRGVSDATRLLPEAVTIRMAKRAALGFDACASNPGEVPEGIRRLGPHLADDVGVIGFPIGIDLIAGIVRAGGRVQFSATADTLRLGQGADFRAWAAEELAAWGLPQGAW